MRNAAGASARPTAVIATNDVFAVGAMIACRDAGVRIPDDVSITGVDNTDLGATQTPPLTSIRTPIVEVGRAAAQQLIARLEGRPPSCTSCCRSSWSGAAARRRQPAEMRLAACSP